MTASSGTVRSIGVSRASLVPSPARRGTDLDSSACARPSRVTAVAANERKILRCAIYTRKSSDQGLEQDFNSLDAQREAAEAYIKSQAHEGWKLRRDRYDDGGFSGGSMERALQQIASQSQVGCRFAVCTLVSPHSTLS